MTDARPIPPTRIVLLGMMGSGKSSVGRALADLTGWPFIDNDALVEEATGRTARELLAERGEAAMRDAEAAALRHGLSIDPPVVVAAAAGTILDAEDRTRLAGGGFVVWLTASPAVLATRAAGAEHRPWLDGDAAAWFEGAALERDPLYREVSDLEIDTSTNGPGEAAQAARLILDAVSARP
jgi:shikimate kinase